MTELNSDGTCTVLGQRLTTEQVERLIFDLASARASMKPEVPQEYDASDIVIPVQATPDAVVAPNEHETITAAFRHMGLGWIVLEITPAFCEEFGKLLLRACGIEILTQGRGNSLH